MLSSVNGLIGMITMYGSYVSREISEIMFPTWYAASERVTKLEFISRTSAELEVRETVIVHGKQF